MSYLSASPNVGYNGLPQLLLSDGNCASQYQMATEATSALSEDALHLYQEKDQTIISDPSCMEVEDNIFSSTLTMMNEGHVFHELDHEQLYNVGCIKQADTSIQQKGYGMMLVNGTGNSTGDSREAFLNAGQLIKHNNSEVMLTTLKETNAIIKLTKSNKDSIKIRSKLIKPSAEQVIEKDCINAKVITVSGTMPKLKSLVHTKKSISSNNDIRVKSNFSTIINKIPNISSSMQVIKWEGPELEPATPSSVRSDVSLLSTRRVANPGTRKAVRSKVQQGRGPALHEALQRIVARPPPLTENGDSGSGNEDDVIPYFGMSLTSGACAAEWCGSSSRGARLACRRASLRRLVAQAAAGVKLMRPRTGDAAHLAHAVKMHAMENIAISHSPRLSGEALDLLLNTKGMADVLTPRERNKLRRRRGWRAAGGAACVCGAASLPCLSHCVSHVTSSPEQLLYGSCAAVFAGGARCTAPVSLALASLCQEHAWKRDNYDRLSQEFKPKKSIERKPKTVFGGADPFKKAKKQRRSPNPVNRGSSQHLANPTQCISTVSYPGQYVGGREEAGELQQSDRVTTLGLTANSSTSLAIDKFSVAASLGLDISAPAPS